VIAKTARLKARSTISLINTPLSVRLPARHRRMFDDAAVREWSGYIIPANLTSVKWASQ